MSKKIMMSNSMGKMNEMSRVSVGKIQDKAAHLRAELRSAGRVGTANAGSGYGTPSVVEDHLNKQIEQLKNDLKRRQETYVRRERAYTVRLEELEQELAEIKAGRTGWMKDDRHMAALKALHREILRNVDQVQERTAKILQEQERDLSRSFKARLFDVQTELEKEKGKKDDGAAAYIEKAKQLEEEVDRMREMADRLDRVNGALVRENGRLKAQFQTQEEDRDFLIKQLVQVKRENKRLQQQVGELEERVESGGGGGGAGPLDSRGGDRDRDRGGPSPLVGSRGLLASRDALSSPLLARAGSAGGLGATSAGRLDTAAARGSDAANNRLKDINKKLRKLLDRDRKNLEAVRRQLTAELRARTELETLLRQAADDVKREIARRRRPLSTGLGGGGGGDGGGGPPSRPGTGEQGGAEGGVALADFGPADREAALELLLSQERVIHLLYAKTFPPRNQDGESMEFAAAAAGLGTLQISEDELRDAGAGLPSTLTPGRSSSSGGRALRGGGGLPMSKDSLRGSRGGGGGGGGGGLDVAMPAI